MTRVRVDAFGLWGFMVLSSVAQNTFLVQIEPATAASQSDLASANCRAFRRLFADMIDLDISPMVS